MRILSRYLFRELLAPTTLGFSFYTFIILMKVFFDYAEMIIKRSLPFSTIIDLLALSLPHIVVLTIPMSLLVGILVAVGRLSADSEIIAMQSTGLAPGTIYRPIFAFSFVMFLLNLTLMAYVLPWGNSRLQKLRVELYTSAAEKEIKPRVFFGEYDDLMIYVNDVETATGAWKGVFISDTTDPSTQRVVVASAGRLTTVQGNRQVWLDLDRSETHVTQTDRQDRYDRNRNETQRILLVSPTEGAEDITLAKSLRELDFPQLFGRLRSVRAGGNPEDARYVLTEIHNRIAIPFACITFGILGLPLGITNRRGGKSSGFSLSIGIILVYYIMLNNGEDLARSGRLPVWLAMWLPNAVLLATGIWLMGKIGYERRRGMVQAWLGGLVSKVRRKKEARTAAGAGGGEALALLARLDIPFPNTLDRYILKEFARVLMMVILSTTVLFLVVDYSETVEEISANQVPFDVVATYYRYLVLQILNWVLPISVLIATVITFGLLSKNNEITAIKSNGISLYRTALPAVAIAAVVAVLSYFLIDFVLPYSNQRVAEMRSRIRGKDTPTAYSDQQRQWVFGNGRYVFNFLRYDRRTQTLSEVQVFEFHPTDWTLSRRVAAKEARFDGVGWVFFDGWIRSFGDDGGSSYTPIQQPIRLQYPERPAYFQVEAKAPEQMTWSELRGYIANVRRLGYAADELTVKLWEKTSWPFISVVMALIALPFSFKMGKKGALYGVGIALFLAFVYWALFGVFTKLGEVGNLPGLLAAWAANVLFMIGAIYMFLRVET